MLKGLGERVSLDKRRADTEHLDATTEAALFLFIFPKLQYIHIYIYTDTHISPLSGRILVCSKWLFFYETQKKPM